MVLNLPKGYRPPEGARPDEPFEVVATVVLAEDGSFKLKTLDGVELDDEDEEQEAPFELDWDKPDIPEY